VGAVHGAYARLAGEAELRRMGETLTYFLATGESTGGEFALVEETARGGEAVPLHRHPNDIESFYVLDGEISFFLDDGLPVRAHTGTFVHVPAGAVHGFRIESETARYLILTTARHGDFYRAITNPEEAPPNVEGERIREAAREYGIEFVGPLPD
jgi:quercetin dioxygenase-like cupin family protein